MSEKKGQKIRLFRLEDFQKVKLVEIRPDGNLVQITGKNAQGKSSTIDGLEFGIVGVKALKNTKHTVRQGADLASALIELDDITISRTLAEGSSVPTLVVANKNGKLGKPQQVLDSFFNALTFDPLAFVAMDTKSKVAELRRTAKVDLDFDAMAAEDKADYDERTGINKEVKELEARLKAMTVLEGLPAKRIDEQKIMDQLNSAGEANQKAQEVFVAKQNLGAAAAQLGVRRVEAERGIEAIQAKIKLLAEQLEKAKIELKDAEQDLKKLAADFKAAEKVFRDAPEGTMIDVAALTTELQSAQRTNRAIEQREAYNTLQAERDLKQRQADTISTRMKRREEQKREALANAKIPVKGLTFNEREVLYNGIPIENLGEGEQIRISTQIGIAANPDLRVMCIRHGEALDEDGLKIIADLADKHDFQIWMSRVDSSGKVGIVIEDGMVKGAQ